MLTLGNAFAGEPIDAERLLVLALAFTGTVALWWCYFDRAEAIGASAAQGAADPSRVVAIGNYTLIAMVVGVVAIAVGDELAIADPDGPTSLASAVLIFGGPIVFLVSQLVFMRWAAGRTSPPRAIACLALLALAGLTAPLSLLAAVLAAGAVLVAVAVADTRGGTAAAGPS